MDSDFEYIRNTYNVPAERGRRIKYNNRPGTIVGANGAYLKIQLDGEKEIGGYHPTYEIDYYPTEVE